MEKNLFKFNSSVSNRRTIGKRLKYTTRSGFRGIISKNTYSYSVRVFERLYSNTLEYTRILYTRILVGFLLRDPYASRFRSAREQRVVHRRQFFREVLVTAAGRRRRIRRGRSRFRAPDAPHFHWSVAGRQ